MLGNLAGSLIAYAAGYYGRIELLDRNKLIHVNRRHLESADRWFERHGSATVFFTRMLPIIRTFISLPAGVARMPLGRFVVFTVAGSHPLGPDAGDHRPGGRRPLGPVEGLPALRRLRGRRRDRDRRSSTCSSGGVAGAPSGSRRPRPEPGSRRSALGAVQGPAELLPVSSSAHLSLLPWLAGWRWHELDPSPARASRWRSTPGRRPRLLIGQRRVIADELRQFDARRAAVVALSFVPPAIVGYRFERQIERRLGGPRATAVGLDRRSGRDGARRPPSSAARAAATPPPSTASPWASPRPRRSRPASPATARRSRPPAGGASPRSTPTCSRAPSPCR